MKTVMNARTQGKKDPPVFPEITATADQAQTAKRYSEIFSSPLQQQSIPNHRIFMILFLIEMGHKTSDALIDMLEDQLHRTTVFALLLESTEFGLTKFRAVITKGGTKRQFYLTQKGRASLEAYNNLLAALRKGANGK